MTSIAETLRAAGEHYQAGRYADAEQLCRQVLAHDPRHPEASFQLGLLAMEARRPEAAAALIRQALDQGGPHVAYYNNLALACDALGQRRRAVEYLRQAVVLEPEHAEANNNLGALLQREGQLAEAIECFSRALRAKPDFALAENNRRQAEHQLAEQRPSPEVLRQLASAVAERPGDAALRNRLGLALIQAGQAADALPHFQALVELQPEQATGHVNLAHLFQLLGRDAEAAQARARAVQLDPRMEGVFRGVRPRAGQGGEPLPPAAHEAARQGSESLAGKDYLRAIDAYRAALDAAPEHADLWNNLGAAQRYAGHVGEAEQSFLRAIELDPDASDARTNLGLLYLQSDRPREAIGPLEQAVESDGSSAEAPYQLGNAWRRLGNRGKALDRYLQAIAREAGHAAALAKAALTLHELGRAAQADRLFDRALELEPDSADVLNNWGNALQDLNRFEEALDVYRRAVAADPQFVPALCSLGYVLNDAGRIDEARDCLERALALQPDNLVRVMLSNALPTVYSSVEEVTQRRQALEGNLQQLRAEGVTVDTTNVIVPTLFYLAYQGFDDRNVHEQMAHVYRAPEPPLTRRTPSGKIRLGLVSKYFRDHTIGRLNLGLVRELSRDDFEVVVIAPGHDRDPLADAFRRHADRYCELPYEPHRVRQAILAQELDVLLFADVGMDPLTYTLAFSRMAPVQCVTWGHPSTTGSPAIDYFISSERLEIPEADEHYTEQLVRLPDLAVCYERPQLPPQPRDRASFGFAADAHLYVCPQSLFKLHPEFDAILGSILRADPRGELVLLEGKWSSWGEMVRERFARTMPDVCARVRFLPRLSRDDFLSLNAVADVLVDPIHFCGGNTSYEGLALGTPIVTLPSQFLRGRITAALYDKMGLDTCVVRGGEQYAALAVRLGTEPDFRRAMSDQIAEACPVLYGDTRGIRQLEDFLRGIAR